MTDAPDAGGQPAGASFYALGPEFEWLASAWDGFARDLAEASGTLRHIVGVASADPVLAAESSGLSALESATDRLVRELVDDAARIRRTLATYEQADAAVHASVPRAPTTVSPQPPSPSHSYSYFPAQSPAQYAQPPAQSQSQQEPSENAALPQQALWHPEPDTDTHATETTMLGTLSRVRRDILARAEHWVQQSIPYSQQQWHEGYRTDCAGYVSMCWGLRDSMVTSTMPHIAHQIAKENLRAGDVLLNTDVATGHVILFDRWADYAHSSYVGFELCPQGTLHHVLPYPYYGGTGVFTPYRYNNAGD